MKRITGKEGMRRVSCFITILATITLLSSSIVGDTTEPLLTELAGDSKNNEGKKITLTLKFKSLDYLFNKIYFYDRKNIDIVFDIAIQTGMEEYKNEMLNLREGLDYRVTFIFDGLGNIGLIKGELIRFTPVILLKLPRAQ